MAEAGEEDDDKEPALPAPPKAVRAVRPGSPPPAPARDLWVQIREVISYSIFRIVTGPVGRWLPVGLLAVGIAILICDPAFFSSPRMLDAKLPSEDSIPAAVANPEPKGNIGDIVWRFRYAPTGTELRAGIPYWLFRALPRLFDDEFKGGGYERFGFGADSDDYYTSRPVGRGLVLTDTRLHVPFLRIDTSLKRVAINCSGCHRGEYLKDGKAVYVDGMPNHTGDLQGFKRFFARAFTDDRFNAPAVIDEINRLLRESGKPALTQREEIVYEFLVGAIRKVTAKPTGAWMDLRADNGPGRIDPFNAVKFEIIGVADDHSAGQIDFPSLWNQDASIRPWHHVDGNTRSSRARNFGSILGVGGIAMSIDKVSVTKIGDWLDTQLPVPKYPFAAPDPTAVEQGKKLFATTCAICHGVYDPAARTVTRVAGGSYMERKNVGTDVERTRVFLKDTAAALNDFGSRRDLWDKDDFRAVKDEGAYLCGPLDGIWARAPYLHNGSLPNLRALLERRDKRPVKFYRGHREYDEQNVGWVSTKDHDGDRAMFEYKATDGNGDPIPGNGNQGHEVGVDLSQDDKDALLAYLKTL